MQKIIIYSVIMLLSFVGKLVAQEKSKEGTAAVKIKEVVKEVKFEKKIQEIATAIDFMVFREKNELKMKVDSLEILYMTKKISSEELNAQKQKEAETTAKRLESNLEYQRNKIDSLIQYKVDNESKDITFKIDTINGKRVITYFKTNDGRYYDVVALKYYKTEKERQERLSKRTTSQFVFALGLNNLITQGENLENSDYRVWGSHFYEWGLTYNTRILKNHNLLHAKYGFSVMYNNLRPTDNRLFVKKGNQTELQTASVILNESRFRNVQLVFPVHLEFDFSPKKISKDGTKTNFRTHESVRLGIGGYGGFNIKSKQITRFERNGNNVRDKQKGDFNASNFVYGLSTYIGYKQTSLYLKYDINPLFKNNVVDQNNISLGLRFDFN
jgi:hypothetical protein